MAYYWVVWSTTCGLTYLSITLGGVDAMLIIAKADSLTGWDMSSKIDPTLGTLGLTVAVNEILEPVRLPFVVWTVRPVVDFFSKYY